MENKKENGKSIKKPWPTKDAMDQIYKKKLWGGNESEFYSGYGSHNPDIVNPYIHAVTSFLSTFKEPLVVCDLGCGDFNIGRQLMQYSKQYYAVDIVKELIEHNRGKFKAENLEFYCLDIAVDNLPAGDCVLLRQVLQHLSNAEVQSVVNNLADYKYIILTEHLPEGDFIPNRDIISGQGIRLKKESGLDLLAPPFNLQIKEEKVLSSIAVKHGKGVIETKLYRIF